MLQGQGDGGPTRKPKLSDWRQTAERTRGRGAAPDGVRAAEARPTPLPKVNFTLLGLGPAGGSRLRLPAAPSRGTLPPPPYERPEPYAAYEERAHHAAYEERAQAAYEPRAHHAAYEQPAQYAAYEQPAQYAAYEQPAHYPEAEDVQLPSDAELEALLRRVDAKADYTIETDARPVRPPWLRGNRRRSIWAGLVLYLAVGSATFLWFAQRAKKAVPEAEAAPPEPVALAVQQPPAEPLVAEQESAPAASAPSAEPIVKPASASPPQLQKAERQPERRVHKKKSKRSAKQLAARAKRKKRARRAAHS
jgi:hypothetical protein